MSGNTYPNPVIDTDHQRNAAAYAHGYTDLIGYSNPYGDGYHTAHRRPKHRANTTLDTFGIGAYSGNLKWDDACTNGYYWDYDFEFVPRHCAV